MSKILLKQPKDGKYVEYDTDKYTFINKNMSVDDYINISKSRAEQQADKEMSMSFFHFIRQLSLLLQSYRNLVLRLQRNRFLYYN